MSTVMTLRIYVLSLICLVFATLSGSAYGGQPEASPVQRQEVDRALDYMQQLDTMQARFVQTAPDGSQLSGTFYLDRPGHLRFEYDAPVEDFVVADGQFIYFYDAELDQQTNAPIGQTLADFVLRPDIGLHDEVGVKTVSKGGGLTQITFYQKQDPGAGQITLGFAHDPYRLKRWRVVDPQGKITEIELFRIQTGVKLADSLFVFRDPKPDAPRYND